MNSRPSESNAATSNMTTSTTIDAKNVNEIWKNNFSVNNNNQSASAATATLLCNGNKMADLQLAEGVKTSWAVGSAHNNANGLKRDPTAAPAKDNESFASKKEDSDSNSAESANCKIEVDEVDLGQDANDAAKDNDNAADNSPSHHARRPMNAFLIFCKKHRPIVRKIHPTLENRGVTRILGEWWSLLDCKDKDPYTKLAKQYKDAFFSANPDFKWYKLPAPPLRTLPTRPTKLETNSQPITVEATKCSQETLAPNSPTNVIFTPGKLADESQLGMLSSLFPSSRSGQEPVKSRNCQDEIPTCQGSVCGQDGQNVETENCKGEQEHAEEVGEAANVCVDDSSDLTNGRKSHRKGKGSRYAEFMADGRLIKNKRVGADKMTPTTVGETGHVKLDTTIKKLQDRLSNSINNKPNAAVDATEKDAECAGNVTALVSPHAHNQSTMEATRTRTFSEISEMSDVADYSKAIPSFDLDARIAQLPNLSYDTYTQRKKEMKKRKLPKGAAKTQKQLKKDKEKEREKEREAEATRKGKQTGSANNHNKRRHDATDNDSRGGKVPEKQTGSKKRKNKHNITHLKNNTSVNAYEKLSDMSGLDTLAEIASNLSNNNNNCSSLNNNTAADIRRSAC